MGTQEAPATGHQQSASAGLVGLSRLLRDLWVVFGLALGQLFLTFLFVTCVPYAYWSYAAHSNPEVKQALGQLGTPQEESRILNHSDKNVSERELQAIGGLLKHTPWVTVVILGSLLIYPFLGWWGGKLLNYPETSGLVVLFSVVTGQNLALIPQNIEYLNLAPVTLSLPTVLGIAVLQFFLLTGGLLAQIWRHPRTPLVPITEGEEKNREL